MAEMTLLTVIAVGVVSLCVVLAAIELGVVLLRRAPADADIGGSGD